MTIDEIDRRLITWVQEVFEDLPVVLTAPSAPAKGPVVGLLLIQVIPSASSRAKSEMPLQATLRYLVTVWGEPTEEAHRVIGELLFNAMDKEDLELEQDGLSMDGWTALGMKPQPSFVIRVPQRRERLRERAPLIRQPMVINGGIAELVEGVVLGPDDIPITGARVELPAANLSTQTDSRGRFRFAAVPPLDKKQLRLHAKGRKFDVVPQQSPGGSLVIRLKLKGKELEVLDG